jgi:geranylgeranyl diphosphate synthase type II
MAAGQAEDLCGQQGIDAGSACRIATCKTSPLFQAAAYCGAIAAGASEEHARSLREYGTRLGAAYQIADDLRDHKREDNPERSTNVVAALGTDGAVHALNREVDLAKVSLDGIPCKDVLFDFAEVIRSFCHA